MSEVAGNDALASARFRVDIGPMGIAIITRDYTLIRGDCQIRIMLYTTAYSVTKIERDQSNLF